METRKREFEFTAARIVERLDNVRMSESDRRLAKAQVRQAEAVIDLIARAVAAIRSILALPQRLRRLSTRARRTPREWRFPACGARRCTT